MATFAQNSITLILDETQERPHKERLPVSKISDILNRSAIEKALQESAKKLKLGTDHHKAAEIIDVAEVNGVEMFEGIKGQHIRHITIDHKIYLYSLDNYQGLIAVRGNQILFHYVFKTEDAVKLKILDDINQNGLKEILLQFDRFDRRGYFRNAQIIEVSAVGIAEIFYHQTFENRTDVPVTELRLLASKIYFENNKSPIFYEEQFEKNGNSWKSFKAMKKLESFPGKTIQYIEITKLKN